MFHYKVTQPTFRNNRLWAPGETIDSEKVLVSRALVGADDATQKAVDAKRAQLAIEKAQTPEQLRAALASLQAQLLKYQVADAQSEVSRRDAEEKAKTQQKPPMPAPRRIADQ